MKSFKKLCLVATTVLSLSFCTLFAHAETMKIDTTDLLTGETTTSTMTEFSEDAPYPATTGSVGTLPTPYMIIGDDDRNIVEETTRVPYRYIGRIETRFENSSTYNIGTGFLVGKSAVLTAAHCVYSKSKTITTITFIPGKNGTSNPYGKFTATKIHVPQKYKDALAADDGTNAAKYDYALIELGSPIGSSLGYFALGGYNTVFNTETLVGTKVTVAGYPGQSGDKLYRHKSNILSFNAEGYMMYYDIDTTGGQSGSPVIKYDNGNYYVVGIHRAGGTNSNKGRYITKNVYELVNKYQ